MTAKIVDFRRRKKTGRGPGSMMTLPLKREMFFKRNLDIGIETALMQYDFTADLWGAVNEGTKKAAEALLPSFYSCLEFLHHAYVLAEVNEDELQVAMRDVKNIEIVVKNYCLILLRKLVLEGVRWKLKNQ